MEFKQPYIGLLDNLTGTLYKSCPTNRGFLDMVDAMEMMLDESIHIVSPSSYTHKIGVQIPPRPPTATSLTSIFHPAAVLINQPYLNNHNPEFGLRGESLVRHLIPRPPLPPLLDIPVEVYGIDKGNGSNGTITLQGYHHHEETTSSSSTKSPFKHSSMWSSHSLPPLNSLEDTPVELGSSPIHMPSPYSNYDSFLN